MLANGIIQTTTTTGTGALTLSAVTGCPTLSAKFTANATEALADHFYYSITDQSNPPVVKETGIGYLSAANTLQRAVVLSTFDGTTYSDTAPTALSLTAGTYYVMVSGEAGSSFGPSMPAINNGNAALRYVYSAHMGCSQYGGTATTMTANTLYVQPFLHTSCRPIDGLFFRNSNSTGNQQIGLYGSNPDGTVGRKIMGSTANVAGAAMTVVTTGGPVRLAPGWYWIAIVSDNSATVINSASTTTAVGPNPLGHDGTQYYFVYATFANGSTTLPASGPATFASKVTAGSQPFGLGVRYVA